MKQFQISEDEFLDAHNLVQGRVPFYSALCFGLLLSYLLRTTLGHTREPDGARLEVWVPVALVSLLLFFALLTRTQKRQARAVYREQKSLRETISMTFDNEDVEWKSDSGHCRMKWDNIVKHKENARLVLVFESRNLMRIVPKRAFESDEELSAFCQRLKSVRKPPTA
ncbi:MAG: YcxB family protein [Planctomycetota bacterium]|nr:YcxB family protein [Planctomycetota bacterium]